MFFSKKSAQTNELDCPGTIIGKGICIEAARLKSDGEAGGETVRIDGVFKGSVEIDGSLVLGDEGHIAGDVSAGYFLVAGEISGNIACDSRLHFASSSKVYGDVRARSIIIDEGAQVAGRYVITGDHNRPVSLNQNERLLLEGE